VVHEGILENLRISCERNERKKKKLYIAFTIQKLNRFELIEKINII